MTDHRIRKLVNYHSISRWKLPKTGFQFQVVSDLIYYEDKDKENMLSSTDFNNIIPSHVVLSLVK